MPMNKNHWFYVPVNPEPWAVGPLQIGRKNGKPYPKIGPNQTLVAFQQEFKSYFPEPYEPIEGEVEIELFFWRRLDKWVNDSGKTNTRNVADVTNMQKACEDAMQGVLITNDRNVKDVSSHVMDEGPDVVGGIAVCVRSRIMYADILLPAHVLSQRWQHEKNPSTEASDNSWPPMQED